MFITGLRSSDVIEHEWCKSSLKAIQPKGRKRLDGESCFRVPWKFVVVAVVLVVVVVVVVVAAAAAVVVEDNRVEMRPRRDCRND